ncbi:protein FAR1-RELATED SEQUENCE 4-like [Solanum verrucosum]|uniref:protein FAR1-RELATED SEQUENCE 4-like n=1 Tax=Solanum verrucosum TaxID=315347 RepID=UPI0020D17932|nr:protein FAR1-RELATED SEQUENCE 4-like [Solanum verrucosum]
MELTSQNSQLNDVLNNALGLDEDDSLLSQNDEHHEDSDDAYDGPEHYLHSDDEDVINKLFWRNESIGARGINKYSANDDNFSDQQSMEGPLVDMVYCSVESLFAFYKEHSRLNGFGVLKKTSKKRGCEYAMYVSFACDKSRKPTAKNYSKRVDCKCKVNCVVLPDSSCRVTTVTTEHNHELQPYLARFFGCHKKTSKALKRNLEAYDIAGIRPAKSIRLLEVQTSGPDRMGCTPKDCRNYILQQRMMRTLSCDAAAIQKFFALMQMKDDEFFYVIDTDNVGRLRNVVWVHTHCKYAYREFSDVVCFDSMYLVNQWRMPFASFVGVNQHKQSILLGCALLTSEDIETYKFVFSTRLTAMAILTDQCESIKAAIAKVLPDTIHRYCIWHIMTKLPAKLKGVWDFKIAKSEFKSIIYNSITINEFEEKWVGFIQKYELQHRLWFHNLYLEKEKWIYVFLKHYFWADMMSTQRSESMHAFFYGYISGRSSLKQFVEQYELALRFKYEKELQAEADSRKTHPAPCSDFDWDLQLQTHYTRPIYDVFAAEYLKQLYHCEIERHHDFNVVEGVEKYSVTDYSISNDFHGNRFVYNVEYRPRNQYLDCNCKKFQSKGVVCCHILKTMSHCRIKMFHDGYILRRWRRDVIRPHIGKFFQEGYPSMTDEYKKYNSLKKWFDRNCDVVLDNNAKYVDFKNVLKGRFNAYCNWNDEMAVPSVGDPDSKEDVTFIRNPREVRTRGRPPTNRCRRGGGRWNRTYYHADQVGETSQGRRGGGRRGVGRRAGRSGQGGGIMT